MKQTPETLVSNNNNDSRTWLYSLLY